MEELHLPRVSPRGKPSTKNGNQKAAWRQLPGTDAANPAPKTVGHDPSYVGRVLTRRTAVGDERFQRTVEKALNRPVPGARVDGQGALIERDLNCTWPLYCPITGASIKQRVETDQLPPSPLVFSCP